MMHPVGELQTWFILCKRAVPLGILYSLLYGTHGEDEEGGEQHAIHWDQVQSGQRDETELGQEAGQDFLGGGQDTQDSKAQQIVFIVLLLVQLSLHPGSDGGY